MCFNACVCSFLLLVTCLQYPRLQNWSGGCAQSLKLATLPLLQESTTAEASQPGGSRRTEMLRGVEGRAAPADAGGHAVFRHMCRRVCRSGNLLHIQAGRCRPAIIRP
jgi:hypothetical protein